MGRNIKHNADYFPHRTSLRNSREIKAIRSKYKHTGLAVYYMFLEELTAADFFRLPARTLDFEMYAGDFELSSELLIEIYNYMVMVGVLVVDENGWFYCPELNKELLPLVNDRKRKRPQSNDGNLFSSPEQRLVIPVISPEKLYTSVLFPPNTPDIYTEKSRVEIEKSIVELEIIQIEEKISNLEEQRNDPQMDSKVDERNKIIDQIIELKKEKEKISAQKENESKGKAAELIFELKNSFSWREKILRDPRITINESQLDKNIDLFINELDIKDELYKDLKEIKNHFFHWIIIKISKNGGKSTTTRQKAEPRSSIGLSAHGYDNAIELTSDD